ncbi:MAG: myo-inositol 2-dehydrogenase/D-chiro-inositol 1-dehydrogenase [Polaribacter sp.]|jgi:myo-inositol 2-dehydrogenase/D-chiro-inositol 1-dehydrogenase
MINFALLGAGRIGSIHGGNVLRHRGAKLKALYDPFAENADRLSEELNCDQLDPEQIFSDPGIDAVLICSATNTHADLIEQAVASGKHVFCEKPIDLSLSRVRECCANVAATDRKALVAFNRRFDSNFQLLKQQCNQGIVGDVEMVSIISKDPSPPPVDYIKISGGLFRDMTIHDFDMARFILSEEITEVSAQASCLVDPEIGQAGDIDSAMITLKTASGKLAQIVNSRRASYGYDQRIEIHGSKGMLEARNVNESTVTSHTETGVNGPKPLHFFLERYEAAYRAELDTFIRSLNDETVSFPSMQDGLQALLIAEAAMLSYQQGRSVKISEIG